MTMTQRQAVVGVFTSRDQAERAVDALRRAGFRDDQIGFVVRQTDTATDLTNTGTAPTTDRDTAGGAVAGAVGGGVVGGLIGAAAALLIPGIGPVLAGGILAATLGGAAIGAAAGGLLGALTEMGVPEEEARYYDSEFQAGRTIVTVQAGGRYQEALNILRGQGAYDASTRSSAATGTVSGATAYTSSGAGPGTPTATGFTSTRWEEVAPNYRSSWQQRYSGSSERWEDYEPAYRYGWERYNEPQYRGRSWAELEPDFRRDWESRYRDKPWDRFGNAVREAWDNLTGSPGTRYDPNYRGPNP